MLSGLDELRSDDSGFKVYYTAHPNYNKEDLEASITYWMTELGKEYDPKMNVKVRVKTFNDVFEIMYLKEKQENVLYITPTIDFLILRNKIKVEPIALTNAFASKDHSGERFIVVTSKTSGIKSINELKKARISISKEYKNKSTLYYWINNLFYENFNTLPEKSSQSIKFTDDSKQALTNVFFGTSDACLINKSTFNLMKKLNPQIEKKLQIINESEDFVTTVMFLSEEFDNKLKTFIVGKIMTLNSSEQGRQISKIFKLNGIKSYKESMISSVKKLYLYSKNYLKSKK